MQVNFDAGDEMTTRNVFAISRLLRLLECTHEGGEQPCAACAGEH